MEPTYMASDLFILVCGEWNQRDKAHCEPWPTSDAAGGPVAAVTTLGCDLFGALEVVGEFLSAECYTEGHFRQWRPR